MLKTPFAIAVIGDYMNLPDEQNPMRYLFSPPALSLLLAVSLLGACSGGPGVNQSVISAATSRGVSSSTTSKMEAAGRLDFADLQNLVSRGVPSSIIMAYLNSVKEVIHLAPEQLAALKAAGADSQLLAYLEGSQNYYGRSTRLVARPASTKAPAGSATNSPLYQDEQPFAYNEPAIDGFYDSGYEESLYSPFSFN